ncbi:ankyrin repeat [Chlorella sorokiniana]|uniref:Ankyrin repeat n=1 Tax=Chlorella sorokiniana TaxID=3076 RepID=A0A2P6TIF7_CHLSO|nr:ankyrin repeat [Chlorella sorokiniana]|eukprot:PRW34070.1 ankyrin repeat [Chlorella sorokiniana]
MHAPAQGCAGALLAPPALLAALLSHDAEALAPHLAAAQDAQQGPLPLLHGIAACAEAAWAVEQAATAVPIPAAAGHVHRLYPHRRALKALVPLLGEAAFCQLMDPLGSCALSLAAALGHTATLKALLDAGADANPVEPSGRPMWHPLAAAAMAHDSGNVDSCGQPLVSEATAVEMCELLLACGADVAACLAAYGPACQWRRASWLLQLHSRAVQRLLLRELLRAVQRGRLHPNFELGSVLLLLTAQAGQVLRVPSSVHSGGQYPCPVLALLSTHATQGLDPLDPSSLAMAEALSAAGYRPATYCHALVLHLDSGHEQAQLVEAFEPAVHDAGLCVAGSGRYLWLAATNQTWHRANHASFPPAFRAATRELLLAAHRLATSGCGCCAAAASAAAPGQRRPGSACRDGATAISARSGGNVAPHLGHLPVHVLDEILQLAAHPLSTWAAAPWEAAACWLDGWDSV